MPFYDTPATLSGEVARMAAEQRRSAANRRLESAVIGAGGIQLLDANGDLKATIGALPTGGTGIAVVGTGGVVSFEQLAFGKKIAQDNSAITLGGPGTGATYGRGEWLYLGPDINDVEVTGGRLTVVVGCDMNLTLGPGTACMGVRLVGPSQRNPDYPASLSLDRRGEGMSNQMGASREIAFEGLADGTYTIQPAYINTAVGSPGAHIQFRYRSVSATLM